MDKDQIKENNQALLQAQKLVEELPKGIMNFHIIEKERKEIEQLLKLNGIDFVFEKYPELNKIGSKQQYENYIKTIFPESVCQNIVYHGNKNGDEFEEFKHRESVNFSYKHNSFFATSNLYDAETGGTGNQERLDNIIPLVLNMPQKSTGFLKNGKITEKNTDTFQYNANGEFTTKELDSIIERNSENWRKMKWKWKRIHPTRLDIEKPDRISNVVGIWKDEDLIMDLSSNMGYLGDINEEKVKKLKENGLNGVVIDENDNTYLLGLKGEKSWYIVFEPEQIHILGSQKDIERFKEFIKKSDNFSPLKNKETK